MDERARAEDLDRFLDELALGGGGDAADIDPNVVRIARSLRLVAQPPAPDGARDRVWRRLAASAATAASPPRIASIPANGHATRERLAHAPATSGTKPVAPPRSPVWRARFAPLASALALVVVAATGYLFTHRNGDDRRMTIPAAVVATARPSADDPVVDTLLTIGLPTGKVPSGHGATSGLALFTIPVGARSTWMPTCCAGPMIEYVLQGAYGVRAQAPLTVVRAGGTVEEVAPGLEVSLAAGDALISRNETVVVTWNDGLIPTVLLDWIVIDGGTGHLVPGWRAGPADFRHGVTPPNRGTIRLVRVTLTDGGEIAFDHPGRLQFVVSATGASGDVVRRTDDSIKAIRAGAGVTYVAYVLSVEPDSPATPSASSPAPMPDL